MASVQCYKTCEQSCQQKNQHESLGQKVAGLFKGQHSDHSNAAIQTQTQCCTQTQVHSSHSGHAIAKTQTTQCCSTQIKTDAHATGATDCHGRNRREHNRNLVQKIKDGLSGHSSDTSSDSESDNENCHKRKN
ncbi:unnamed protein product [Lupinus luteus]|uniref:Uncharacterized protein n=1 Tax=Lupinus luteus TaxID=3873 RepID=A0AAV1YDI0_LUPLU